MLLLLLFNCRCVRDNDARGELFFVLWACPESVVLFVGKISEQLSSKMIFDARSRSAAVCLPGLNHTALWHRGVGSALASDAGARLFGSEPTFHRQGHSVPDEVVTWCLNSAATAH